MTVLILCLVSFLAGLAIGLLLDEAARLLTGRDDVRTLTRSGAWRPFAASAVLVAMLLNGWTAWQLLQSRDDLAVVQGCSIESTDAAIELWQGLHDLLADNPEAQPVVDLVETYLDTLHELQAARAGLVQSQPCQPRE